MIENVGSINTQSTEQFDFIITGEGTLDSPWLLTVDYAASAGLDGLPDVDVPAPLNGQVLSWDEAAQQWVAAPPTTAAAGGSLTGNGIEGDGSAATPLEVTDDNANYITVRTTGVGLTDEGINRLVRVFADAGTRAAATPVPTAGTLSILLNNPGRVDYFDGTDWFPIDNGIRLDVQPGALMELSGPYTGGLVIQRIQQIAQTTDTAGDFPLLSAVDLTGYAGVLSVTVQPVGEVGWSPTVRADDVNGEVLCRAFRLDDGTAYAGYTLSAVLTAWLY